MSNDRTGTIRVAFWDELEKISAKRENRSVKKDPRKFNTTRKGSIGIRPHNLLKEASGAALSQFLKGVTIPGLAVGGLVGIPLTLGGLKGFQDWQMGRRIRRMQRQQQ
tara:strand:+ start:132 stop:455 length:324 start_codon:yes stop_codon:yes gene_type:complete